jgi:hypothetical protein
MITAIPVEKLTTEDLKELGVIASRQSSHFT